MWTHFVQIYISIYKRNFNVGLWDGLHRVLNILARKILTFLSHSKTIDMEWSLSGWSLTASSTIERWGTELPCTWPSGETCPTTSLRGRRKVKKCPASRQPSSTTRYFPCQWPRNISDNSYIHSKFRMVGDVRISQMGGGQRIR